MSLGEAVVKLVDLPENPVPEGAVVSMAIGRGRVPLRVVRWPAPGTARGTVVVVPGRAEFVEKYFELVADLRARGFAVAIADLRGQGGSGRLGAEPHHGHVGSFHDYVGDLEQIMERVVAPNLPPPYYGLGHSTGGTVLLLGFRRLHRHFDRIVATAPVVQLPDYGAPEAVTTFLLDLSVLFGFGRRPVGSRRPGAALAGGFDGNPLTSDRVRFERMRSVLAVAPELGLGPPTLGWAKAAYDAGAALRKQEVVSRLTVPTLLFACGADRIVSVGAVEKLGRMLPAGGAILVPGARHELLMERERFRSLFWAGFDAFVPGGA